MSGKQEIIKSAVENFFDNEYKEFFNVIKLSKWYTNEELNNYDESEISCKISKESFCEFVNEMSEIFNDENMKSIFDNFTYKKKKKLLDFIILFTFLIYEIIENNNMTVKLGHYVTYYILSFFEYYNINKDSYYEFFENNFFKKKN